MKNCIANWWPKRKANVYKFMPKWRDSEQTEGHGVERNK